MTRTLRTRIEMQGFTNLSDAELHDLRPWLKLAPALCLLTVGIGMITQSELLFALLIPMAAIGAILPWHPFDLPYSLLIRGWIHGPPMPPHRAPRRFACAVATAWLCGIVWLFHQGAPLAANLLAGAFMLTAAMPVVLDFCIPSFFYQQIINLLSSGADAADKAGVLDRWRIEESGTDLHHPTDDRPEKKLL